MDIVKDIIVLPEQFPFKADNAVINRLNTDTLRWHWHECFEISFVKSGEGVYYVNGRVFPMKKGDIILFNNMEPHAWNATSIEPMIQPVIVFDPVILWSGQENLFDYEYLKPFNGNCTNFTNKLPDDHPVTGKIFEILSFILQEYTEKPIAYHLMIKAKLLEIMTYLIRYFQSSGSTEPVMQKRQKLLRLQKAIKYINANYTESIGRDEVARLVAMNANYFSTFFKDVLGLTFMDYLSRLRILKAVKMIEETDETYVNIAYTCGFNSISNFYRAFKKFKGGSPTDLK